MKKHKIHHLIDEDKQKINYRYHQELAIVYPNPLIEFYAYSHPAVGRKIEFVEKFQKENNNA